MPIVATGQITIADVNDGDPGPALTITSTAQGFTFLDGVATPAQQFIGFQAVRYATTDPVQWFASNGATLSTDLELLPMAAYLSGVYGSGDGDIAYMSLDQFGGEQQVVITALAAGLTATLTLMRLGGSTAAAGATVGATIGVNLSGQITPANASTFIAGDAIVAGMVDARGLSIKDAAGNVILSAGATLASSTLNVPGTVTGVPAEWQNSNVTMSTLGYTGALNATNGAPEGTLVGSTLAQAVESNASSGNLAYSQVTDVALGLSQRMRTNSDNILGGVLVANAVSAPAGLRAGSVTWDAAGTITGGVGVAVTPKGIFARNASKTSFVLDATTGDATFAGSLTGANITGATGTFSGSLTVETLGSMAQPPITVTASGSVTVPAGMTTVRYEVLGGGGGGGGGATAFVAGYGGGGGAGGYMSGTMAVTPGASLAIVIGGGGAGGANATAGGAGAASTLAGVVSAAGGVAGGGTAGGFGSGGAAGASVPVNTSTAGGTATRVYDGVNTTHDGYGLFNSEALFNGAGFPRFGVTGAGGSTPKGSGGSSINTGIGQAGAGYGSGGGGGGGSLSTSASAAGGAGRVGVVVLTFFNSNGVVLQTQLEALKTALVLQGITVT